MLLGRPALMRLRVSESGEVAQLTRDQMHALIQTDAELSALATTSAGFAFSQGLPDSSLTRMRSA
jgi:2-methylisocitrate lyase-like PEP mutase family enzyme